MCHQSSNNTIDYGQIFDPYRADHYIYLLNNQIRSLLALKASSLESISHSLSLAS